MFEDSFKPSVKLRPVSQDCRSNHRSLPFLSRTVSYVWPQWWRL